MPCLQTLITTSWQAPCAPAIQKSAISQLESGKILYFPHLAFLLSSEETLLLSPRYANPAAKNISYDTNTSQLQGIHPRTSKEHKKILTRMLHRYAGYATQLIENTLPRYNAALIIGRTSYRPVQIDGRVATSYRKDDKRLHVDAFPSAPNQGKRILRVFSNINPHQEDRVWRIGEPFEAVVKQFQKTLSLPLPGQAALLHLLHITKSRRSLYDHIMLQLHDHMKADEIYQQNAQQEKVSFPTGSSWIVQTDHVSHAVVHGQYALEQTFYLPINAMQNEQHSPLRILEKNLNRLLIERV
ncbi:MAG: hypothetical protein A3E83_00090 [Gammaproteobacteria bacterium RIFCSPHIGHO2_12_FULL_41_20]|nr:MAG: hypothetical protein A3E83_00090 [Gammaproteobacteria bacterium RIFCSPHIGHO2_12_FULL_41_20]